MEFSRIPIETVENIFSYLDYTSYFFEKNEYFTKISGKLPRIARKEFIESLHPFYLFIWKLKDFYCRNENTLVQKYIEKNFTEKDTIFLIENGFKTSELNYKPIFLNCNFELIKYYHSLNKKLNIHYLDNIVKNNRIDIIQWLIQKDYFIDFCSKRACMEKAVLNNKIEMLEFMKENAVILEKSDFTFFETFEFELIKGKINKETLKWCWENNYRWTREEAEYVCQEKYSSDLLAFFN